MSKSINRIYILTKRNFKEIIRDPLSLIFIIVLPLVMEILFYFLFSKLTIQFEMKYLAPGIVVFSQSFLSLFIGLLIALDRSTSFLTRLYVSKAKSHEFVISYALALLPIILIQSSLFFIIGGLFDNSLFKVEMTVATFLIPFIFAITNYITKKYGFRRALSGIIISAISMILFILLMCFAVGTEMNFSALSGGLIGYLISQIVNTMIYKFLLTNTNSPYILVLLNYVFAYIVFYMVYTVIHLDMIILDTFWISYFIVLAIQTIMSLALAFIDKKIIVGIGKDD